jgi:hypothetical protein
VELPVSLLLAERGGVVEDFPESLRRLFWSVHPVFENLLKQLYLLTRLEEAQWQRGSPTFLKTLGFDLSGPSRNQGVFWVL